MTDDVQAESATTDEFKPEAEIDPMLEGVKEAEEEIAATKGKDADATVAEAEPAVAKPEDPAKPTPMIPKPRFDEVLADRDVLKGQVGYWQGVANTQAEMLKAGPKPAEGVKEGQPAAAPTDYAGIIAKAENDKLAAAKRYEDGEISLVDFKTQEIQADRLIREQTEKRTDAVRTEATKTANEAVNANNVQRVIETTAIALQEQHPYVNEIDKLPPAQRDLRWRQITDEAVTNLQERGVAAYNGKIPTTELIAEKASLTDKYGPQFTGKTIAGQKTGQSDTARERAAKLDLSTQQPPTVHGNVQATKTDLTERDVENMDQDQIADAMMKAPQIIERAAGFKNR